jgi:hypothetical protein
MQAAKPRPALTFTYDAPVERPRPDYRLVLVCNAANELNSSAVCSGTIRVKQGRPGIFNLYAVYCRNDQGDVGDDGLDAGERSGRSAHRWPVPRVVSGRVQRFAGAQAQSRRRPHSAVDITEGLIDGRLDRFESAQLPSVVLSARPRPRTCRCALRSGARSPERRARCPPRRSAIET